jgi:cytochrome c556
MSGSIIARGVFAAALALLGTLASAAANIDLTDFNDDVMKNMDDTVKSLDSDISGHDGKSAQADAGSIRDGLHWAEEYFTRKGKFADAVELAREGQKLAASVATSAASNDFDAALTSYDSLVKTCRRCHDAYKPPEL